jgi:protein SCO1/2
MLRRVRWFAYGLIAVALLAWGGYWLGEGGLQRTVASVPGAVSVGGPFSLVDTAGKPVTDATYRGRWMLVYFGYTFCPDVCPTELQTVSAALDKLGPDAAKIVPLFITIDPERDTVAALADYVKLFDDRLIGLTGTDAQIAAAARDYRVYYARATPKDSTNYLMDHSSFLYLMGPDGQFRALFRPGTTAAELADALRTRMQAS